MRPSRFKTRSPTDYPRPCSPIGCKLRNASCPRKAATAGLRTSISAPPERKSAARLAARRTPAAAAKRARTRGRRTCDDRRRRSIGVPSCPWRKASSSTFEPSLDRGGALLEARRRHRPRRLEFLSIQRHAVFLDPPDEILELRKPTLLGSHLLLQRLRARTPARQCSRDRRRLAAACEQALPTPLLGAQIARDLTQLLGRHRDQRTCIEQPVQMRETLGRQRRHRSGARVVDEAAHRARLREPRGSLAADRRDGVEQPFPALLDRSIERDAGARQGRFREARAPNTERNEGLDERLAAQERARRKQQRRIVGDALAEIPRLPLEQPASKRDGAPLHASIRFGTRPMQADVDPLVIALERGKHLDRSPGERERL